VLQATGIALMYRIILGITTKTKAIK